MPKVNISIYTYMKSKYTIFDVVQDCIVIH